MEGRERRHARRDTGTRGRGRRGSRVTLLTGSVPVRRADMVSRDADGALHVEGSGDHDEKGIAKGVNEVVPPRTSGIVAVFEEIWVKEVERQLAKADKETARELKQPLAEDKKQEA